MEWIEATIDTTHEGQEAVCTRLAMLGIEQLLVQDETEFLEFLQLNKPVWEPADPDFIARMKGICRITFYVTVCSAELLHDVECSLVSLSDEYPGIPFGSLALRTNSVREEDWAENWKTFYKPVFVGKRLLVQPAWVPPDEIGIGQRTVFLNNPGMSFGTGEHETTRMCLDQIDRLVTGGERVLDVGCGSGILSICALLLGAHEADAVDIDPHATATALQNARANGMDPNRFRVFAGDLQNTAFAESLPGPYQLIMANIVSEVIVALCPLLYDRLALGGRLIVSGIIESRREDVLRAMAGVGLHLEDGKTKRDWCCLVARKN